MATTIDAQLELTDKIRNREAIVSVVGLGYVGLPLATAFAEVGFRVVGVDVNVARVESVMRGDSYIGDVPSETLAQLILNNSGPQYGLPLSGRQQRGGLTATVDTASFADADVVIVCVPTPLGKTKDPDLSFIVSAAERIAEHMHPGMLVVLESTSYPGTTEELVLPILQRMNTEELVVGKDFFLAFSPERIDPGRTDWTLKKTPKVVGGVTPECLSVTTTLYDCIIENIVPVSSPKAAEMTKLLENTFRATNIALVNEFSMICERLELDVWEVIEAAKTKPFGFMPFYPGPGLGGHCLPIDPQYLAWKLKMLNYNPRFIQLASEINSAMPEYVVERLADALNDVEKSLRGSRCLVLGVAYKANVSDLRDSPALDLIQLLRGRGMEVSYHDPHVPALEIGGELMASVDIDRECLEGFDCALIATAHDDIDWQIIVDHSKLVMDTRNATHAIQPNASGARVVKL